MSAIRNLVILIAFIVVTTVAQDRSARNNDFYRNEDVNYDWILDETPRGEVERLLRDYPQNQELVRNLGSRYYQVVYPTQVRQREKFGVSTREVDKSYSKFGGPGRGINDHTENQQQRPNQQKHYRRTSLLIKAFQHNFRLDLELNTRLIAPNIRQKEFLKEGAVSVTQQDVEHCYYHGTVKDFQGSEFIPGSMAALQTCNGVSGIVHLGNETFVIHPFYGGDLSKKHPHVIYEYSDRSPQGCAVPSNFAPGSAAVATAGSLYESTRQQRHADLMKLFNMTTKDGELDGHGSGKSKRDVRAMQKFIETALVIDKAMFDKRAHSSRKEVIHDAIQVANIADLYFKNSLNTRLSIVYIETWQDQNQSPGFGRQRNIQQAMKDFSEYVGRKLYTIDRDTTQLLTGQTFENGRSTIATVGTICAGKAVGISVDINIFEPHILAANLAHAIGHNLGFHHDTMEGKSSSGGGGGAVGGGVGSCLCPDWHGCIMRPSVIGEEGIQPYKFSTCSHHQFNQWMTEGHALCLLNKPNQIAEFGLCGNGVVDQGEDCDCGSQEECQNTDPCCDSVTCRLKRDAECSAGPCCDNCKLRPIGTVCRQSENECDLTELCTGFSGECPQDLYVKNAVECNGGRGYCFNGQCPTMIDQCRLLWGHKSEPADDACFLQFNMGGTPSGNCGMNKFGGGLKKCDREHMMCGTLHCQSGSQKPRLPQSTYSTHTQTVNGQEVQCKVTTGALDPDLGEDLGMVQDGTKCGEDMICMNQTCTSLLPLKSYTRCPVDANNAECSGRGVCSNVNTCVCTEGFAGIDCSEVVTTPFPPPNMSTKPPDVSPTPVTASGLTPSNTYILKESDSDTIVMVIMLVAGVGGVFFLFALMALCYRRKSALPKYEPPGYAKRQMMKGYSQHNSPHPSQHHITPDHSFNDVTKMTLAGGGPAGPAGVGGGPMLPDFTPAIGGYRPIEEHGLQQMKQQMSNRNHHGLPPGAIMPDQQRYQTGEKGGILKKPYGAMDVNAMEKEKWLEDNADRLSRLDRLDRLSMSSQSQLAAVAAAAAAAAAHHDAATRGGHPADTLKSLNGYHEGILEALRSAANSHRGSNSSCSGAAGGGAFGSGLVGMGPGTPGPGHHRSSAASLTEELRKTLAESYFDYGGIGPPPPTPHVPMGVGSQNFSGAAAAAAAAAMAAALKSSREKLDSIGPPHPDYSDNAGPIRIRNLEDLIRQLEHSSRHLSPSGSEDLRDDSDRHFRVSRTHSQDREDQVFGGHGGHGYTTHRTTSGGLASAANSCNNTLHRRASASDRDRDRGTRSPAAGSHGSASSSLRMRASASGGGGRHGSASSPPRGSRNASHVASHSDHPRSDSRLFDPNGVDTVSNADGGGMTPGSAFDASEVDSEEYLRAQLMRSASDEALGVKSDDLEDDVDSIRSPFYKPRTPLRYPLSPQSPPSDESSYQGSIGPGSAPSDRSYNGGRGDRGDRGGGGNGLGSAGHRYASALGGGGVVGDSLDGRDSRTADEDIEVAMQRAGFFMPDYKH